jgi:hypothetical protein
MVSRTMHPNPEELRDIEALEAKWFGDPKKLIAKGKSVHELLEHEERVCLAQ